MTTYKAAWFLTHRIREAMETEDAEPILFGIVELDETLLTGRNRWPNKTTRGLGAIRPDQKIWVAGALQRGGQVRIRRIPDTKRAPSMHSSKSLPATILRPSIPMNGPDTSGSLITIRDMKP